MWGGGYTRVISGPRPSGLADNHHLHHRVGDLFIYMMWTICMWTIPVDYARHKKQKLFVCYVDFSKAYDRVPRHKLIECLLELGCGSRFLSAIVAMHKCTKNILRTATMMANIGVRQGASTSCLLFTIYINKLVTIIKDRIENDGFLGGIHCMLLMDDTVLLSTCREMCIKF